MSQSPTEDALIEEYQDKGLREQVHRIAGYCYNTPTPTPTGNWWQVHDLHTLALTGECPQREYREKD